ncbi:MAG TPA: acetaldehyde dehydrogenase (acetylating) [Actinomycetes bacterium]|jgi:acetaldehyde dehydrogenase|nr:acetaldehyde dehydrogenase (acetylating) [Actinomycetes bacterium]
MGARTRVAILGSGNIGTDLMMKLLRSQVLELAMVAGIDPASEGLARAREVGLATTTEGIDGLLAEPGSGRIVFDATSARSHARHAPRLAGAGRIAVDLTPAAVGPYVVPGVSPEGAMAGRNVNLISCGAQATIPMVHAVQRVAPVRYAEIVATIASRSAGPGTRQNIDEFTQTTARGIERVGGAEQAKAIIVLNPAEPPIVMRDAVYALTGPVDREAVTGSVLEMVEAVRRYVPGYRLRGEPIFDDEKVTVFIEVEGAGDWLPRYAGNLDIMTSAAVRVGEEIAQRLAAGQDGEVAASG